MKNFKFGIRLKEFERFCYVNNKIGEYYELKVDIKSFVDYIPCIYFSVTNF